MQPFISVAPALEDNCRGIVLCAKHAVSDKCTLAKSFIELNPQAAHLKKLEALAPAIAKRIVSHLKQALKQALSASSQYLDTCRRYGIDDPNQTKLVEETARRGFVSVNNAFHSVGAKDTKKRLFIYERLSNNWVRTEDTVSSLTSGGHIQNLWAEVEASWNSVCTGRAMCFVSYSIFVKHDTAQAMLFSFECPTCGGLLLGARGQLDSA
jgi:hypothetical protein